MEIALHDPRTPLEHSLDEREGWSDEERNRRWLAERLMPPAELSHLGAVLSWRAQTSSDYKVLNWTEPKGKYDLQVTRSLTYAELWEQASRVARMLRDECGVQPGDRVLCVFEFGLNYWPAFCGCFLAGAVAVPAYPPDPTKLQARLPAFSRIAKESGAKMCLTSVLYWRAAFVSSGLSRMRNFVARNGRSVEWPPLTWKTTDSLKPDGFPVDYGAFHRPADDDLAFIQYTSGSTSDGGKGVMVTHRALRANLEAIGYASKHVPGDRVFSWLPAGHDMGLVGSYLCALWGSSQGFYASPIEFIKNPMIWMTGMSKFQASFSQGPNFAWALAVKKYDGRPLDLSYMRILINGAEPVRPDTLRAFLALYAPMGLSPSSARPSFGLAESCVYVTGNDYPKEIDGDIISAEGYVLLGPAKHRDTDIRIVDLQTCREVPPGCEGEIWVTSQSLAIGYWGRQELSQTAFYARLEGTDPAIRWLRTGDLGRLVPRGGDERLHLVVSGRERDMIILGGVNKFPTDIEAEVADAAPELLRPGCAAAFAVPLDPEGQEIILVTEVRDAKDVRVTDAAARRALAEELACGVWDATEVPLSSIVFIPPRSICKTTSGKVQRRLCASLLASQSKDLPILWREDSLETPVGKHILRSQVQAALAETEHSDELAAHIEEIISEVLGATLAAAAPGEGATLAQRGLDSIQLMRASSLIKQRLGISIGLTDVGSLQDAQSLAVHVRKHCAAGGALALDADAPKTIVPDPAARYEPFPLMDMQSAYLFGRTAAVDGLAPIGCQIYEEIELTGPLRVERYQTALRSLVQRHDALRVVFDLDTLTQRVLPEVPDVQIEVLDLDGMGDQEEQSVVLQSIREEMCSQILPADEAPLLQQRLTILAPGRAFLHIAIDLLPLDFYSIGLILEELRAQLQQESPSFAPLELTFRDCVLAQAASRKSRAYALDRAYWTERAQSFAAAPELPTLPRELGSALPPAFRRYQHRLSADVWLRTEALCKQRGTNETALLASVYAAVLSRWSGSPLMAINLTIFNRLSLPSHADLSRVLGDFTSSLLLELSAAASESLATQAARATKQLGQDIAHSMFSGIELMRHMRSVGIDYKSNGFVFTSILNHALDLGHFERNLGGRRVYGVSSTPGVLVDFQAIKESDGGLMVRWDCRDGVFPPGMLDTMFRAFTSVLDSLPKERAWDAPVDVRLGSDLEARQQANSTQQNVGAPDLLHLAFHQIASTQPTRAAICAPDGLVVSYGALLVKATRTAALLEPLFDGVPRGERKVAVFAKRGWRQAAAALAAHYAGAAWVPLATDLPPARITKILHGCRCTIVLADEEAVSKLRGDLADPAVRVQALDATVPDVDDEHPDFTSGAQPSSPAYIIHTSGSTGEPKGVVVSHEAAANTCWDLFSRFSITSDDCLLAVSRLGFDLSVFDLALLGLGCRLVTVSQETESDPAHWLELVMRHRCTIWNSVPVALQMLLEIADTPQQLASLRLAMVSGDVVPAPLVQRVRAEHSGLRLWSLGGATECSIWSIAYPCDEMVDTRRRVPYGRPLANQRWHVLSSVSPLQHAPTWVTGELVIAGKGLAIGYTDPAKTAASFVTDPASGERLYRTGDLGRYLPDGTIEILGRMDSQVKTDGGHRVELTEIESTIDGIVGVKQSVVALQPDRTLVAFITTEQAGDEAPEMDPVEKAAFRDRQLGILAASGDALEVPGAPIDETLVVQRKSYRSFESQTLPAQTVHAWLDQALGPDLPHGIAPGRTTDVKLFASSFFALKLGDSWKYAYPSAGGLYPCRAFLEVGPGHEVQAGIYYIHLQRQSLVLVKQPPTTTPLAEGTLRLSIVAHEPAIEPAYGKAWRELATWEAGYMLGLASDAAARQGACLEPCDGTSRLADVIDPQEDVVLCTFSVASKSASSSLSTSGEMLLFVRRGAIEGLDEPSLFRVTGAGLEPIGTPAEAREIDATGALGENGTTLASSRLVVCLLADLRDALEVGRAAWRLQTRGLKHGIGSCPIPRLDAATSSLVEAHALDSKHRIAQVLLCGPVSQAQLLERAWPSGSSLRLPRVDPVKHYVAKRLPSYMVPARVIYLSSLPLSSNGKVDRKALPMPSNTLADATTEGAERPFAEPATEVERRVRTIVAQLLEVDETTISVETDFFAAGGNSLQAVRLITRLKKEFEVTADYVTLFQEPTVRTIAACCSQRSLLGAAAAGLGSLLGRAA